MSATVGLHPQVDGVTSRPRRAPAVVALARVEGRRLLTHPAILVTIALTVVQGAPFLLSRDATSEHDVGWILLLSVWLISFGALLAANLQALKSRRDGSEELFRSAPLPPAARTVALALGAVWVMAALTLFLLAGDVAIRAAGRGAATDSGRSLFPLFDLVQGPLVVGLFVLFGIAVARWFPRVFAGPVALVGLFVVVNMVTNSADDASWLRLTPFGPTFLDDGAALEALHVAYLAGLAAAVLAIALLRFGWTRGARAGLAAGLGVAAVTGALQLAS